MENIIMRLRAVSIMAMDAMMCAADDEGSEPADDEQEHVRDHHVVEFLWCPHRQHSIGFQVLVGNGREKGDGVWLLYESEFSVAAEAPTRGSL